MGSFYQAVKEANDRAAGKARKREPRLPDVDDCEEMPVDEGAGPVELSVAGAKSYRKRQRVMVDGHWRVVKSVNAKRSTVTLVRPSLVRRAWWAVRVAITSAWVSVRRFPSWLVAWFQMWRWNREIDRQAWEQVKKNVARERASRHIHDRAAVEAAMRPGRLSRAWQVIRRLLRREEE